MRQPWRMARSYLRDLYGPQIPGSVTCFAALAEKQVAIVDRMLAEQIHTVETSSCGRLFDAIAVLLGFAGEVTFEGQAAIALEGMAIRGIDDRYEFAVEDGQMFRLDLRPTLAAIVRDLAGGRFPGEISACFHNTLSVAIGEICRRIGASDGLNRVCLSGGSFQNLYLLEHTVVQLRRLGFEVFLHALVPANDGGLSLGQAVIANQRLREGG